MRYQVIEDDFYPRIISCLREMAPEFQSVFDDEDGVYMILADFGGFIEQHAEDKTMLEKCANFITHAIAKGGHKTEDAIVVQVFEQIYGKKELEREFERLLKDKALAVFERHKSLQDS